MAETVQVQYRGAGPMTVGHMAWYPGETWNVDPKVWEQLQADGVPVCLLQPIPEAELDALEQEPEAKPKRKSKQVAE